jgi:hypothetical protein
MSFSLICRKDNDSPVFAKFVADVQLLPEVRSLKTEGCRFLITLRGFLSSRNPAAFEWRSFGPFSATTSTMAVVSSYPRHQENSEAM